MALVAAEGSEPNGHANGHTNGELDETFRPRRETPDGPRGREAVRIIVRERPGLWTLSQLRVEMIERGWFTSPKGLEAAAKRLCDLDGEGRRLGPGRYVFPANHGEEDAIESDPSDGAMIPLR